MVEIALFQCINHFNIEPMLIQCNMSAGKFCTKQLQCYKQVLINQFSLLQLFSKNGQELLLTPYQLAALLKFQLKDGMFCTCIVCYSVGSQAYYYGRVQGLHTPCSNRELPNEKNSLGLLDQPWVSQGICRSNWGLTPLIMSPYDRTK